MESKDFLVDKNKILSGEYNKLQVNPGKTVLYTRNSNGTLYVDSNSSDINRQRLVINLVGTKYNLNSYENVLKTEFEEFKDEIPDITADETAIQDMSGQLNDLENQIKNRDQKINNLNAVIDELNGKINAINSGSVAQAVDVAGAIKSALDSATKADNKKPRIFSDGTLLRDRNNTAFYYVVEDGKKRWFQFNEELLNIVAKASGKIKIVNGNPVPDLLDVSQDVLDDIPAGSPFTNFDLVKNVQTPAPPPLDLEGKRLTAKWINIPNPLIITTTNTTPTDAELTIPLQLQVASAEGIVNSVEVWEDGAWYQNKPQLPIYDPNPKIWNRSKVTGFQQGFDSFKVMLRKTNDPVTDSFTSNDYGQLNQELLDRYTKIKLSLDNPEYTIKLAAKILNDVNDEYYQVPEDCLTVIIRYVPKMPNVTNLTISDARAAITATGVLNTNINESNLILTNNSLLYDKVQSATPIAGADINKNSIINLITYKGGLLTVPQNISFYSQFNDVVRVLKRTGFNNISVSQIYRSGYTTQDLSVSSILKAGNVTLTAGSTYSFDKPIYLKVNIWNDGRLIGFVSNTNQPDSILISYLNNLITTIV